MKKTTSQGTKLDTRNMSMAKLTPYFFVAPVFILSALLVVYPLVFGMGISFFDTDLTKNWDFVGLDNYIKTFTLSSFPTQLLTTFKFTICVVTGHFIVGTLLGVALNKDLKGTVFFRVILVLPWLFQDVVIALLFKWILNPLYGLLNFFLQTIGTTTEAVSWLGSINYAFPAVVMVCIWKGYPLVMVNVLAALQSVPKSLQEAARVDGANKTQVFFQIVLPSIKPVLATTIILDTVWWFKHYTMIELLTSGGPNSITSIVSIEIYKQAFDYFDFGEAAAMSVIVFITCVIISKGFRRLLEDD